MAVLLFPWRWFQNPTQTPKCGNVQILYFDCHRVCKPPVSFIWYLIQCECRGNSYLAVLFNEWWWGNIWRCGLCICYSHVCMHPNHRNARPVATVSHQATPGSLHHFPFWLLPTLPPACTSPPNQVTLAVSLCHTKLSRAVLWLAFVYFHATEEQRKSIRSKNNLKIEKTCEMFT